jgi:cytochrome c oxidase subunit 2
MMTKVEVMTHQDFDAWYSGKKEQAEEGKEKEEGAKKPGKKAAETETLVHEGAELIQVKGCIACHTTDGTPKIGPTFKGVFGRKETVVHNGKEREITVDEAFIRQTLLHPEIDRVKRFPPIMPSQQGQLTDAQIDAIIAYIKSLK